MEWHEVEFKVQAQAQVQVQVRIQADTCRKATWSGSRCFCMSARTLSRLYSSTYVCSCCLSAAYLRVRVWVTVRARARVRLHLQLLLVRD